MSEYIKREAAYNAIVNNYTTDEQLRDLDAILAADVVPVVRCNECVHHDDGSPYHYCRKWRKNCPDDSDFFCKWGKRKDGDGERRSLRNEMD